MTLLQERYRNSMILIGKQNLKKHNLDTSVTQRAKRKSKVRKFRKLYVPRRCKKHLTAKHKVFCHEIRKQILTIRTNFLKLLALNSPGKYKNLILPRFHMF